MTENDRRVARADLVLGRGGRYFDDPYDFDANLTDLLADSMHWAKHHKIDWDNCLDNARDHFGTEDKYDGEIT